MREIKFRAWVKQEQKMYLVIGVIKDMILLEIPDEVATAISFEKVELMQYIGLKDVAGRDIFEGDILGMENATAKVVFWGRPPEFGLNFSHNDDEWCDDWNLADDHDRMEIIGNIYENHELLEIL